MDLRSGIVSTANALGIDPVDLATVISYETAGTFDPVKAGPTTQWGQHRGLIQWGEPQARQFGVDWNNPVGSQLGPDGAIVRYMKNAGVQPGMGLLDIYSAVNAGRVGRYNASDANNGGAPGTVRDKVQGQMAGHRAKAQSLIGGGGSATMMGGAGNDNLGATPMAGLLSTQPQERLPFKDRLRAAAQSGQLLDNAAMAFNSLRMRPDPSISQMAMQREKGRQDRARAAKTVEWLANQKGGEAFAGAIMAGGDPRSILNSYLSNASSLGGANVQKSEMLPDQSGSVMTLRDGSLKVVTIGGDVLTGQAAIDFVRKSQENAADYERSIYSSRREGTNIAEAETGAAAAGASKAGEQGIQMAGEAWTAAGKVDASIGNIDTAIRALENGAKSGAIDRYLPNITEASASLQNAMDRMGLDVVGAVTFGALSEAELRLAMETAVPRNLDEPQLLEWLRRRKDAQVKVKAMLQNAAAFLSKPGNTLEKWIAQNKGQTPGSSGAPTFVFDPETQSLKEAK